MVSNPKQLGISQNAGWQKLNLRKEEKDRSNFDFLVSDTSIWARASVYYYNGREALGGYANSLAQTNRACQIFLSHSSGGCSPTSNQISQNPRSQFQVCRTAIKNASTPDPRPTTHRKAFARTAVSGSTRMFIVPKWILFYHQNAKHE